MEQQAAKLEAAMLGHTLDVSGMYSDRLGLFGKGWLVLLEDLGLTKAQALNALVAVARVLQGTHGTLAIWKAFTSTLDTHTPNGGTRRTCSKCLLNKFCKSVFRFWNRFCDRIEHEDIV
jgi:hypothetical protein